MTSSDKKPGQATGKDISRPRLTPQGRTDSVSSGTDTTSPEGKGAKKGQGDKAEG